MRLLAPGLATCLLTCAQVLAFSSPSAQQAHHILSAPVQQAYLYNPALLGLNSSVIAKPSWQSAAGYKDYGQMNERFAEFREDGLYDFLYLLNYTGEGLQEPINQSFAAFFAVGKLNELADELSALVNEYDLANPELATLLLLLGDNEFSALMTNLSTLIGDTNSSTQQGLLTLLQEFERINYATLGALKRLPVIQDHPFELQLQSGASWSGSQGQWSWQQRSHSYGMMRFQASDFDSVQTLFADYDALNGFIFRLAHLGNIASQYSQLAQQSTSAVNAALADDPSCVTPECRKLANDAIGDLWELFQRLGVDLQDPNNLGLVAEIYAVSNAIQAYSSLEQGGFLHNGVFDNDGLEANLPGRAPDHITGLAMLALQSHSLGYSQAWQPHQAPVAYGATVKLDAHWLFNHTIYSMDLLPSQLLPQSRLFLRPNLDLGVIWQPTLAVHQDLRLGLTAMNALPWKLTSAKSKAFATDFWLLPTLTAGLSYRHGQWSAFGQSDLYRQRPHIELPAQQWLRTGFGWQAKRRPIELGLNISHNLADQQPSRLGASVHYPLAESDVAGHFYGQMSSWQHWRRDIGGQLTWSRGF